MTRWLRRRFSTLNVWDLVIGVIIVSVVAAAGAAR